VTLHAPVPEQAPLQPLNTCPEAGVAARLTAVPEVNVAEQVAPQLIPAGELETDPVPVPAKVVVSVNSGTKVAVTDVFAFIVTVHVPVPAHAPPLHPVNTDPDVAAAVNVTEVPLTKFAEQVAPQLIPAGELVTVPAPAPDFVTVSVLCGAGENVAVTLTDDVPMVIVQVPVPGQLMPAPVQPANMEAEEAGVAVSVTAEPLLKLAVHVAPQLIPAGELETEPDPVPARVTVTGNCATLKLAVTEVAAFMVTVQVLVPEQPPPLQPVNTDAPDVGAAVSVTLVPWK